MKLKILFNFLNILISIKIIKFIDSSVQTSSIFPVNKIILTEDLNKLFLSTNIRCDIESKGYGIIFNNNYNISLIPFNLFNRIRSFFKEYEDIIVETKQYENELQELIIYVNLIYGLETIHFIFKDFGITIPLKYFLTEKDQDQKYGIRFLTNENQEAIIFGNDLIELMDLDFIDENNIKINNEEFISKMDV